MKKYLKYILLFLVLKPTITAFGYPSEVYKTETTTSYRNMTQLEKEVLGREFVGLMDGQISEKDTKEVYVGVEDFGYHMTNYFEYHNEAFAYSFILTLLTFLFFDKRSRKSS